MHTVDMRLPSTSSSLVRTVLVLAVSVAAAPETETRARQGRPQPPLRAEPSQDARLLVGTWELASFSRRATDGRVTDPWGSQPAGRITYDSDGHVTALVMHEQRNEASGRVSPPEVQSDFSAYFGTYTINTAQRIVTHYVRGSLNAAGASGELRRNYELKDDALILSFTRQQDGAANTLTFKRISFANK